MKNLKNYEKVITDDGSVTYYSKLYNEACHSTSGAETETNLHYVKGCKIDLKSQELKSLNIFEVGFGVGIGFIETLKTTRKNNCYLNFISTEIDPELATEVMINLGLKYKRESNCFISLGENFKLIIFLGNARKRIKDLSKNFNEMFHAIYQDAFSPKKNAILWTTEWFEDLKKIAHSNCIMSTYSSSSSIRKSMISAGWILYKGDQFGPKRSSTRAKLSGETCKEITQHLERSPAQALSDKNIKNYTMDKTHEKN